MAASYGVFSQGFGQVDQGVDFAGKGPIPALGEAVVTDVGRSHIRQGYDINYLVYQLLGGPYKGQYVYVAENFTPQVKVGDHLRRGQSVGNALGAYPYIEVGFNQTAKGWTAYGNVTDINSPAGLRMKRLIQSQIGNTKVTSSPPHQPTDAEMAQASRDASSQRKDVLFYPGDPTSGVLGAANDLGGFISEITTGAFWLRALEVVGGGLMIVMGLYLLARQVGLPSVANAIPGPAKGAADKIPNPVGPSERPAAQPRVVNQYYLDTPPATRRQQIAARSTYDPATSEIPF